MSAPLTQTADETIEGLQVRLRRLEYLLVGAGGGGSNPSLNGSHSLTLDTPGPGPEEELENLAEQTAFSRENTIRYRLEMLDKQLNLLYNRIPTVKHILDLQVRFPELFLHPTLSSSSQHLSTNPTNELPLPTTLTHTEQTHLILTSTTDYQSVCSQLTAITDPSSSIPNPTLSAELVSLGPRIAKVSLLQDAQDREIAELRRRSLRVLERWYLVGIEGVNECFAEWDERTLEADRVVTRRLRMQEEVV